MPLASRSAARRSSFELLCEDDQADPKQGTIVAQKLVDAKVAGVVGHLNSGTTIPASKIYHDAGIPQISPSATNVTYTHQGFKTAFRVMANDAQQGKVLGEFAVDKLGAKNIAIIDDRTRLRAGPGRRVREGRQGSRCRRSSRASSPTPTKTDFTAILTSIKGKKPDLDLLRRHGRAGRPDDEADEESRPDREVPRRRRRRRAPSSSSWPATRPRAPTLRRPACRSTRCRAARPSPTGTRAKFNIDIQIYAPYAYDAVNVLLEAMKKAGSVDPAKYLPELAGSHLPGRDRQHRLRREGRYQGRQHQPVRGQGRQVGVSSRPSAADSVFLALAPGLDATLAASG